MKQPGRGRTVISVDVYFNESANLFEYLVDGAGGLTKFTEGDSVHEAYVAFLVALEKNP